MDISKKLNKLETGLGFGLLTAEIIVGIPLVLYYTASQAYINAQQQTPKINQLVSDIQSNFPDFPINIYNNQDSEDQI